MIARLPVPLQLPAFRSWWMATQGSNVGTWMQQVAAAWLMLDATGSAAMVGALALAQRLPSLVLTPLAGRAADRHDRRRVLALALALQLAVALGLCGMTAFGNAGPTALLVLGALSGVGQALAWPAQLATVSSLVPRPALATAVSLNSAGFNLSRVLGPALAGLLLVAGGATLCFALNALSYAPQIRAVRSLPVGSAGGRRGGATVRAAVRHAWDSPALRRLLVGCAIFAFLAAPLSVLMPVQARELGLDADGLGLLLGAFGLGAVAGAAVALRTSRRLPRHRLIPLAMLVFAAATALDAVAPSAAFALLPLAIAGGAWLATLSTTNASIQLLAPDELRGRVLGLYLWLFAGPMAVSGIAVGWLAGPLGVRTAVGLCAAPLAVYAVWCLLRPVAAIDRPPAATTPAGP